MNDIVASSRRWPLRDDDVTRGVVPHICGEATETRSSQWSSGWSMQAVAVTVDVAPHVARLADEPAGGHAERAHEHRD